MTSHKSHSQWTGEKHGESLLRETLTFTKKPRNWFSWQLWIAIKLILRYEWRDNRCGNCNHLSYERRDLSLTFTLVVALPPHSLPPPALSLSLSLSLTLSLSLCRFSHYLRHTFLLSHAPSLTLYWHINCTALVVD